MRKVLFISTMMLFILSCKSLEKMVSRGDYDAAFAYGSEHMRNPKNHKRENIIAYERAYNVLKVRDLNTIKQITAYPHEHRWDEILNIYIRMNERENSMENVMPLRSKDGYLSKIVTEEFTAEIVNARKEKTAYDYKHALSLLSRGRKGNVHDARAAYELFKEVRRYDPFYEDVANAMDEAYSYGVVLTGIDFESAISGVPNELIMKQLNNLDPAEWNSFWNKYEFADRHNTSGKYDMYMVIRVDEINFGAERELVNNFDKVKTITDGERVVFDKNGVAMRDSSGHKITEPNTIEVRAIVTEARRQKLSNLRGRLNLYENRNSLPVRSVPVSVDYFFEDVAMRISGDKRALDDEKLWIADGVLAAFPDNLSMIYVLSGSFYNEIEKLVKKLV
jgi:hypothetical protein